MGYVQDGVIPQIDFILHFNFQSNIRRAEWMIAYL